MKIEVHANEAASHQAEGLLWFAFEGDRESIAKIAEIHPEIGRALEKMKQGGRWKGKEKETVVFHTYDRIPTPLLLVIGLGKAEAFRTQTLREAAAKAVKAARAHQITHLAAGNLESIAKSLPLNKIIHAVVEAALLADYRFSGYKQEEEREKPMQVLDILCSDANRKTAEDAIRSGRAFGEGTRLARDLVNIPANYLTPEKLANKAEEVAKAHGMSIDILEKKDMEKHGMGGLLAVAQGSVQSPKMIVMKYQGLDEWKNVIGFVGKGVTFDSGGISLKPPNSMEDMKGDMGGAASVIGAMDAIGRLRPKLNVLAVIPATENMPSGSAVKPGDVITTMSGKTVEVLNTDAEGRLILADAVTYAKKKGASRLIDLATLTGAVLVALGTYTTGAMTNDSSWLSEVKAAAQETGEPMWELPTFDAYKKMIRSPIADLRNTGGTRNAGAITAGLFVGAFAEKTPWVHLDIAGTAWADQADDWTPKGGTGVMVRTLVELSLRHAGFEKTERK